MSAEPNPLSTHPHKITEALLSVEPLTKIEQIDGTERDGKAGKVYAPHRVPESHKEGFLSREPGFNPKHYWV